MSEFHGVEREDLSPWRLPALSHGRPTLALSLSIQRLDGIAHAESVALRAVMAHVLLDHPVVLDASEDASD